MKRFAMLVAVCATLAASVFAGSARPVNQHSLRIHVSGCWWVYTGTNCYWWTYWYVTCEDTYGWRGPGC